MTRGFLPIALSALLSVGTMPLAFAAGDSQLNFKIYSPDGATTAPASADEASTAAPAAAEDKAAASQPAAADTATAETAPAEKSNDTSTEKVTESKPELTKEEPAMSAPATSTTADTETAPTPVKSTAAESTTPAETPAASAFDTSSGDKPADGAAAAPAATDTAATETATTDKKVLQGYVREVPAQTKIPIIMDTAVDSDTSQEGDEFAARTSEDLTIDGAIVVPAGSVIKGRIAQLNAPKHFTRGGSVALKFDTVTTPDNRQIPLVANLVTHGGVVHAKRGLKDYAIDSGVVAAPFLAGILIGVVAGKSNSTTNNTTTTSTGTTSNGMSKATAAALGAGVGLAVGIAILCAKKGKKVDVRPGDELKIELAEALRMPMM
jgi:Bacterial conjugation TrbI-like protein